MVKVVTELINYFSSRPDVPRGDFTLRFSLAPKYLAVAFLFRQSRLTWLVLRSFSKMQQLHPPSVIRKIKDRDLLLLSAIKGFSTKEETVVWTTHSIAMQGEEIVRTEFFFSPILLRAFSIKTDFLIKKHRIFSETVKEKKKRRSQWNKGQN